MLCRNAEHSSRILPFADKTRHFVIQQKFDAFCPGTVFQRPNKTGSRSVVWTFQARAFGPNRMIFPRRRVSQIVPALVVRGDILEVRTVGYQKFVSRGAMIGEGAHHRAIVIPVIGPAVGLHDRPVREIAKNQVG